MGKIGWYMALSNPLIKTPGNQYFGRNLGTRFILVSTLQESNSEDNTRYGHSTILHYMQDNYIALCAIFQATRNKHFKHYCFNMLNLFYIETSFCLFKCSVKSYTLGHCARDSFYAMQLGFNNITFVLYSSLYS